MSSLKKNSLSSTAPKKHLLIPRVQAPHVSLNAAVHAAVAAVPVRARRAAAVPTRHAANAATAYRAVSSNLMFSKKHFILFGLITIVIATIIYVSIELMQAHRETGNAPRANMEPLLEAHAAMSTGNFSQAVAEYEEAAEGSLGAAIPEILELSKAHALIATGDSENVSEGIEIIVNFIQNGSESPIARAWAYNALLDTYHAFPSSQILAQIRSFDTFAHLRPLSTQETLRALAQSSIDAAPTSMGKIRLAGYYAHELLNSQLDEPTQQEYARQISTLVDQSEILFDQEYLNDTDTDIATAQRMRLYTLQSIALAAASRGGTDEKQYKDRFDAALRFASEHEDNILVQSNALYARFYYTAFLHTFMESQVAPVGELVSELMNELRTSGTDYSFRTFVASIYNTAESERDHNYDFMELMRREHPAFDQYVSAILD